MTRFTSIQLSRREMLRMSAAAVLCGHPLMSAQASVSDVSGLLASIDRRMFPSIASAKIGIKSFRDGKLSKKHGMALLMKDDKGLIEITYPTTDKGKFILKSGKNLWMFFSDIRRSIRLSSRDSFMGTDATNYDILQLNLLGDYDVQEVSKESLDGRQVYKAALTAKPGTQGYERIVSWIDPAAKKLLKNECYSVSGRLIKHIEYRAYVDVGEYSVPSEVLITNMVNKGRTTKMTLSNVKPRKKVPDRTFTLGYLETLS